MKKIVLIFVAIFITIFMLIVIFGDFKVASSKIECTTANTNTCTNTDIDTNTDTVINDYIDNFCDETKCSSVSVVVMQEGKITIYGDEDALYQIGSMTKAFTGLAVLKLINEKVLSEDDIISNHIKGFTAYYEKEARDITIGQLLTHTSGYTNKETDYPSALEGMSLRAWTDTISGSELCFAPGTGYSYSNVNYNLLGAVIEESTGVSYKEYMEKEILIPLGLADTYVGTPDDGDVVSGSRLMFRRSIPYDIPVIEGRIPAGYMYSSASDMARWMQIWTGADMTTAGVCDTNKDKAKDNADIPIEYKQLVLDVKAHLSCEQDNLVKKIGRMDISLVGRMDERNINISLSDIYYIENVDRKLFIYTEDEVYRLDGSMADVESRIYDSSMVRISRTCIMNSDYLKEIRQIRNSHLEAVMDNGEKLIVSRKYLQDIKRIFKRSAL